MPRKQSDTDPQKNILRLLDEVAQTGNPVEVERGGKRLLICPAEQYKKLDRLESHPEFIVGNPDDLVHLDWTSDWKPDL